MTSLAKNETAPSINLMKVILAALAAFMVGFLLHGPVAGKLYMELANVHPTGKESFNDIIPQMIMNLGVQFITALGLAVVYMLAASSPFIGKKGISGGVILAIVLWFSFLVTSSSIEVIWMGRDYKLWLFEVVSSLLVMITMGAIIASGRKQ